nr:uncharacterized protein LOC117228163 [Megalopta genalis]
MMEFGENDKSFEDSQEYTDRMNFLSKQLSKCKELNCIINERKQRLYDWTSSFSVLQMSNLSKQIKYNELAKEEGRVRKKYIESAKSTDAIQQEFKILKSGSICHNFLGRCASYAESFLHSYTEYSSVKLSKDIELYTQKYEKLQHELSMKMKELESLEMEHGLNCLISDGATKEKLKIYASLNDIMLNIRKNTENNEKNIRIGQQKLEALESKLV